MSKPRLTTPGITDLHWMSVVCTPETTHVEFHESNPEASEAAESGLAPRCSVYVGQVIRHGENKAKVKHATVEGMTVVIGFTLDREMRAALNKYNGANSRADYANTLRGLLTADLEQIRDEYRAGKSKACTCPPSPVPTFLVSAHRELSREEAVSGPPDQWHQMHSSDGVLTMLVSIGGKYGTLTFRGQDLADLQKHVNVAVAQRELREGKVPP